MINCPITGKSCMKHKAFHVTNINEKKEISVVNVCEDCLCKINMNEKNDQEKNNEYYCDFCKLTLEELLKKSRIGCENCYKVFEKTLAIAFEKMQRTPDISKKELKHVGRVPTQWKKRQAEQTDPKDFLSDLNQKMDFFAKEEKYEKCKILKEKIYAFECLVKKLDEFKNDPDQQGLIKNQISEFIYFYKEKESEE